MHKTTVINVSEKCQDVLQKQLFMLMDSQPKGNVRLSWDIAVFVTFSCSHGEANSWSTAAAGEAVSYQPRTAEAEEGAGWVQQLQNRLSSKSTQPHLCVRCVFSYNHTKGWKVLCSFLDYCSDLQSLRMTNKTCKWFWSCSEARRSIVGKLHPSGRCGCSTQTQERLEYEQQDGTE